MLWRLLTFCVSADDALDQHCQHVSELILYNVDACIDKTDLLLVWMQGGVWAKKFRALRLLDGDSFECIFLTVLSLSDACQRDLNVSPAGVVPQAGRMHTADSGAMRHDAGLLTFKIEMYVSRQMLRPLNACNR